MVKSTSLRLRLAGAAVFGLAAASLAFVALWRPSGPNACAFHALTGLWCPLCGGIRATHALLNGNIVEALHWNSVAVVLDVVLAVLVLRWCISALAGRWIMPCGRGIAYGLIAVLLAFCVLRNLYWPRWAGLLGPPAPFWR